MEEGLSVYHGAVPCMPASAWLHLAICLIMLQSSKKLQETSQCPITCAQSSSCMLTFRTEEMCLPWLLQAKEAQRAAKDSARSGSSGRRRQQLADDDDFDFEDY